MATEARTEEPPAKRLRFDPRGRFLGKPVDFYSSLVMARKKMLYASKGDDLLNVQPSEFHGKDMLPSHLLIDRPISSICTNWVHTYSNYRKRSPVHSCLWTPEGRRLLTGNRGGEVAVLNGFAFNSLHQFSAHVNSAVQTMVWAREGDFMLTGSPEGLVYYWQSNMVCIKEIRCHENNNSVRQISISPADTKFATASDDGSVKIWDLESQVCETVLSGHGHNVTCCEWHPKYSLLASGSNDKMVKIWDPRVQDNRPNQLANLQWHRNTVLKVKWNQNGHHLLTCSKDFTIKLTDIRTMQEMYTFDGHKKDVTAIDWHPFQTDFFVSGCADGSLAYWIVGHQNRSEPGTPYGVNQWTNATNNHGKETCTSVAEVPNAHSSHSANNTIWEVKWHPLGHMVASMGNDTCAKIWGRSKPGQLEDVKEVRPPPREPGTFGGYGGYEGGGRGYSTGGWWGGRGRGRGEGSRPHMLRPGQIPSGESAKEDSKMVVTFGDDDEDD